MNFKMIRATKYIAAGIIILALPFGALVGCKVIEHIRLSIRQDLQESFKESLIEYGKR
jgi:pyoverdine/dityrosine biosynthesis protein Dit1